MLKLLQVATNKIQVCTKQYATGQFFECISIGATQNETVSIQVLFYKKFILFVSTCKMNVMIKMIELIKLNLL